MPDWRAITITDFPLSYSLITFNFVSRSVTRHGHLQAKLTADFIRFGATVN
jgi:hypothetical protein